MDPKYIVPVLTLIWLFLCSWQDIRKKQISVLLIAGGFAVLFLVASLYGDQSTGSRIGGMLLGILLLGMNPLTGGQVGIGDGLVVCVTGICLGFRSNAVLLVYALLGAAIISGVLLVLFHTDRKKTIPFVPFLLLGYLGVLVS